MPRHFMERDVILPKAKVIKMAERQRAGILRKHEKNLARWKKLVIQRDKNIIFALRAALKDMLERGKRPKSYNSELNIPVKGKFPGNKPELYVDRVDRYLAGLRASSEKTIKLTSYEYEQLRGRK